MFFQALANKILEKMFFKFLKYPKIRFFSKIDFCPKNYLEVVFLTSNAKK